MCRGGGRDGAVIYLARQLIPEFYDTSSPETGEFLVNHDNLQLGVRQEGVVVNDVILPPWASCCVARCLVMT